MIDLKKIYTKGPCKGCRRKFEGLECIRGFCLPCRVPEDRRELVLFGVPWGSADALAGILKRSGRKNAMLVLKAVHPRLMDNITISGKTFKVRDKSYRWMRRGDWVKE